MAGLSIRGFTLVELLVTLVILGILAAIALPTYSAMRSRSQTSACTVNLRQIGLAINLYATENGLLPPNYAHSGGTSAQVWILAVRPYLGIKNQDTYGLGTAQMAEVLTCPAALDADRPVKWWESNYAVNVCFKTHGEEVPVATITDAANTLMLVDSTNKTRSLYYTPPAWDLIAYRHQEHANALYFDGHVERVDSEDIPRTYDDPIWGP